MLGLVHGAEPGHGWPVAAAYALDKRRRWLHAVAASVLLGLGHLVSSLAVVVAYFLALSFLDVTGAAEPVAIGGLQLGSPVGIVAGLLLVALGVREYRSGHAHSHAFGEGVGDGHERGNNRHDLGHGHGHDDGHDHGRDYGHEYGHDHAHDYAHDHDHHRDHTHHGAEGHDDGWWERSTRFLPVGDHDHLSREEADAGGLSGIVTTAFLFGFAHEEEIEIIGFCTGATAHCLPLMLVYAVAVLVALVALTLLLVAGYERFEDRAARYAGHLPTLSAAVLVTVGLGFLLGVF
jgi:hypothetical protein